jgi:hypothetical protein
MKNTVVIMIAIALLSIAAKIGSHDLWPESVETVAELDGLGFFNAKWTHFEHDKMRIAVAVEDWPTDGESYIDVYGYVFNVHFEQWRRFLAVKIRGAGLVELDYDQRAGRLSVIGRANNDMYGQRLFTFDLGAVYDDRAYAR